MAACVGEMAGGGLDRRPSLPTRQGAGKGVGAAKPGAAHRAADTGSDDDGALGSSRCPGDTSDSSRRSYTALLSPLVISMVALPPRAPCSQHYQAKRDEQCFSSQRGQSERSCHGRTGNMGRPMVRLTTNAARAAVASTTPRAETHKRAADRRATATTTTPATVA